MRVLIESPVNEIITMELIKVLNGFYKDIKSTNELFSYAPYLTLVSRVVKQPYANVVTAIFNGVVWKNFMPPKGDIIMVGICPKDIEFDIIIGYKKDLIETEEAYFKANNFKKLNLHSSDEVEEWFSTPQELMTYLMKKELEWNTTLIN